MTQKLKINLKKLVRLMEYFPIKKKNKTMITLVMLLLKMVVEGLVVVLEDLVVQTFQIFLKISLETLGVAADLEVEELIIEDQI